MTMTFWQFIYAHLPSSTMTLLVAGLLFKTATNALPPKGEPFQFGQWFMEWMRELGQQKIPTLSPAQQKVLADAGLSPK